MLYHDISDSSFGKSKLKYSQRSISPWVHLLLTGHSHIVLSTFIAGTLAVTVAFCPNMQHTVRLFAMDWRTKCCNIQWAFTFCMPVFRSKLIKCTSKRHVPHTCICKLTTVTSTLTNSEAKDNVVPHTAAHSLQELQPKLSNYCTCIMLTQQSTNFSYRVESH